MTKLPAWMQAKGRVNFAATGKRKQPPMVEGVTLGSKCTLARFPCPPVTWFDEIGMRIHSSYDATWEPRKCTTCTYVYDDCSCTAIALDALVGKGENRAKMRGRGIGKPDVCVQCERFVCNKGEEFCSSKCRGDWHGPYIPKGQAAAREIDKIIADTSLELERKMLEHGCEPFLTIAAAPKELFEITDRVYAAADAMVGINSVAAKKQADREVFEGKGKRTPWPWEMLKVPGEEQCKHENWAPVPKAFEWKCDDCPITISTNVIREYCKAQPGAFMHIAEVDHNAVLDWCGRGA